MAQETALRLWQHPEVLDDDERLAGWLRTVTRNIVIDRARRRRARPAEVAFASEVESADHVDRVDRVEAVDTITAALSVLPPHHRAVVFEVYVRDRRLTDVASDLGVPPGTVKSRCHYALQRLRASTATAALAG